MTDLDIPEPFAVDTKFKEHHEMISQLGRDLTNLARTVLILDEKFKRLEGRGNNAS